MTVAPLVKPHDGLIDALRAAHGADVIDALASRLMRRRLHVTRDCTRRGVDLAPR